MAKLSKQDFVIGAIDRVAVRRGLSRERVEALLVNRAGFSMAVAATLASHWFSQQFRHGGIDVRRREYLQRTSKAA